MTALPEEHCSGPWEPWETEATTRLPGHRHRQDLLLGSEFPSPGEGLSGSLPICQLVSEPASRPHDASLLKAASIPKPPVQKPWSLFWTPGCSEHPEIRDQGHAWASGFRWVRTCEGSSRAPAAKATQPMEGGSLPGAHLALPTGCAPSSCCRRRPRTGRGCSSSSSRS